MEGTWTDPINIGSEEMVTIDQLVDTAAKVADKEIGKDHVDVEHTGVRGRNSNNDLIREKLGWDYSTTLEEGMRKTYNWIMSQISKDLIEQSDDSPETDITGKKYLAYGNCNK